MPKKTQNTSNVLDMQPAICDKWLAGLETAVDDEGLSSIDFSDITRIQLADNESTQDELIYGTRAKAQILHAFKFFGFLELPRTWGELQGVYEFCIFMRSFWVGSRHTFMRDNLKKNAIKAVISSFPEYIEFISPYMEQDLDVLAAQVQKANLMVTLGLDYREIEDRDEFYGQSKLL